MRTRFRVGDRVIANHLASSRYSITREGWTGVVIRVTSPTRMEVGSIGDGGYPVSSKCFDLIGEAEKQIRVKSIKSLFKPTFETKKAMALLAKAYLLLEKNQKRELEAWKKEGLYCQEQAEHHVHRIDDYKGKIKELLVKIKEMKEKMKEPVKPELFVKEQLARIKKLPIVKLDIISPGGFPELLLITDMLKIEKKRGYKDLASKEIGQFAIRLNFSEEKHGKGIRVVNLTRRTDEIYDHPCIKNNLSDLTDHGICFGNITKRVTLAWKERRFFDVLDLLLDLIVSPSVASPFIDWQPFFDRGEKPPARAIKKLLNGIE